MDPNSPAPHGDEPPEPGDGGRGRTAELVAGDFLLTVNPVDGSEIEPCPPGRRPAVSRVPAGAAAGGGAPELPLLEREEERSRLSRLLGRGRSVRLTGPPGTGRSRLLDAVAEDCAQLAPDGVIRLDGHRRTSSDLLHELYAAVHHAPGYRPGPPELREALREIGAVVVVDDIEFGGAGLDDMLDATPECAFLIAAHPGIPAPASGSRLEEVFLSGLSRTACVEMLERSAGRLLLDTEADWAADLWLATEGLPQRFVQAGALLALRGPVGQQDEPLPGSTALIPALAAELPEGAREILRIGVALGGDLPGPARLPSLTGDPDAAAAHARLVASGLLTPVGVRHRLAAGVAAQLAAEGYEEGAGTLALTAAQQYTWWLAEPAVTPARAGAEAEVLPALLQAAQRVGHTATVANLAHAAAPLLAAAMRWSAWERALRSGAEAARATGDVARQAYFHHELGVLAVCQGQLDRARSELEASTALRAAVADAGGAVAGRRALTLVEDLARPAALLPGLSAAASSAAGFGAPSPGPQSPPPVSAEEATEIFPRQEDLDGHRGASIREMALTGARRNVAAAGAGALLVAVLGTVVALGMTSNEATNPPEEGTQPGPATTDPGTAPPDPSTQAPPTPDTSPSTEDPDASPGESVTEDGAPPASGSPSSPYVPPSSSTGFTTGGPSATGPATTPGTSSSSTGGSGGSDSTGGTGGGPTSDPETSESESETTSPEESPTESETTSPEESPSESETTSPDPTETEGSDQGQSTTSSASGLPSPSPTGSSSPVPA